MIVGYDTVDIIVAAIATLFFSATMVAPFIYIFFITLLTAMFSIIIGREFYVLLPHPVWPLKCGIYIYNLLYMVIYFGLSPLPSNSHHQDYYIFWIRDPQP